jgi:hypothetical protein
VTPRIFAAPQSGGWPDWWEGRSSATGGLPVQGALSFTVRPGSAQAGRKPCNRIAFVDMAGLRCAPSWGLLDQDSLQADTIAGETPTTGCMPVRDAPSFSEVTA